MREIKFRCWGDHLDENLEVSGKEMYYSDCMGRDEKQPNLSEFFDLVGTEDSPILMQYTGLKDKNGKEIYEGDIVETDDEYYPIMFVTYTADVINEHDGDWDEWYCGFDLAVPNDECKVLHYQLSDKVEVIGNIYENPELLKP